jgi:uncharacterized damage-inducible protein DinB
MTRHDLQVSSSRARNDGCTRSRSPMIGADHARLMARYNTWQNRSLYDAADGIGDEERRRDRGSFFGSVHATLSHLLWADHMWMSRFDGWEKPAAGIGESAGWVGDWQHLKSRRRITDARIVRWAEHLQDRDLAGDLTWWSGAAGREVSKPRWILLTHMFNHQTHHRGQVHAMLTAAGARPDDTDLFLLEV